MIELKITLFILIFYSLMSSFLIRKAKTYFSCIMASLIFAFGSLFIFNLVQIYQSFLTEAVQIVFETIRQICL